MLNYTFKDIFEIVDSLYSSEDDKEKIGQIRVMALDAYVNNLCKHDLNNDGVSDSDQIHAGLDALDTLIKKIKADKDDEDTGAYIGDIYKYSDDLIERIPQLSEKKQTNINICIYFVEKLVGQLKRSQGGAFNQKMGDFILKNNLSEQIGDVMFHCNILIVSEAFFNLKKIQKYLNPTEQTQLSGAMGRFLDENNTFVQADARLKQLQELAAIKSRPANQQDLMMQLCYLFADQKTQSFLERPKTAIDALDALFQKFADVNFSVGTSTKRPYTLKKFFREVAQLITIGGIEKSNSQKKITIIEKKRSEHLNKFLGSSEAQPILSFVDKVILRYHLTQQQNLQVDLYQGNETLYKRFLELLSSEMIVSAIQLRFDTENEVKKPIEFYQELIQTLGALDPSLLSPESMTLTQENNDKLIEQFIGHFVIRAVTADDSELAKLDISPEYVEQILSKFLSLANQTFTEDFVTGAPNQLQLFQMMQALDQVRNNMNSLTTFFVFTNTLGKALNASLPSSMIGNKLPKLQTGLLSKAMPTLKFLANLTFPIVLALQIFMFVKGDGFDNFGAQEYFSFVTAILAGVVSLTKLAFKGISMLSFNWAKSFGTFLAKEVQFTSKFAQLLGFGGKMSRSAVFLKGAGAVLNVLSAIISIWQAVNYLEAYLHTNDPAAKQYYLAFSISYFVIGALYIAGLFNPIFAVVAFVLTIIITVIQMIIPAPDPVTEYLFYVWEQMPELTYAGVMKLDAYSLNEVIDSKIKNGWAKLDYKSNVTVINDFDISSLQDFIMDFIFEGVNLYGNTKENIYNEVNLALNEKKLKTYDNKIGYVDKSGTLSFMLFVFEENEGKYSYTQVNLKTSFGVKFPMQYQIWKIDVEYFWGLITTPKYNLIGMVIPLTQQQAKDMIAQLSLYAVIGVDALKPSVKDKVVESVSNILIHSSPFIYMTS